MRIRHTQPAGTGLDKQLKTSFLSQVGKFIRMGWDFSLLTLLAIMLFLLMWLDSASQPGFLPPLRLIFGLVFVLFAPGYAVQAALFPRSSDLSGVARLALATGSSVAILPPIVLVLDRLPWGLRPWPTMIALNLVMLVCALAAMIRRLFLPSQDRFTPSLSIDLQGWWATRDRTSRRLYGLIAGAVVLALLSAAAILILPKPGERFTEFYLLGPEGQAENFPRQGVTGQPITVTLGIHNLEGVAVSYWVEVRDGQGLIGHTGTVQLDNGGEIEGHVFFSPLQTGENVEVTFLLFRDNLTEPYRTLKLWLKMTPAP